LRDWLIPNPRHARLRRLIDDLLTGRNDLRILDVGCSTGVMVQHLTRYGRVLGTDFSSAAIDAAKKLVPNARFHAGQLDEIEGTFDVITLFDVLEHVAADARPEFLAALKQRLATGGVVFLSTPYPDFTASRRERGDPTLQIIDEEIRVHDLLPECDAAGLQLVRYEAFDVFGGSPEYQALVLAPAGRPGGPPRLLDSRVSTPGRRSWRLRRAARSIAAGQRGVARWFLTGTPPDMRS
jgi:SAM-dependent methyltransferase